MDTNGFAQSFKDSTSVSDSSNTLKDTLVLKKPQTKGRRVMKMGYEVVDGDTIPIFLFDEVQTCNQSYGGRRINYCI
jgi:hypothetical protein